MLTTLQTSRMREYLSNAGSARLKRFFTQPGIPDRKLRNATEACGLRPGIDVLALVDFTFFGSAKEALLICTDGLHYRWPTEAKPKLILYSDFLTLDITSRMGVVHIGPNHAFAPGFIGETALAQLLSDLKPLLEDPRGFNDTPEASSTPFRAVFVGPHLNGLWVTNEADTKTPITIATWCAMKGASSEIVARASAGSYRVIRSTKHDGWFCMFGPPELDPDVT